MWVPISVLVVPFLTQLLANGLQNTSGRWSKCLGCSHPWGRAGRSSWLCPVCCNFVGKEPADRKVLCACSVCLSFSLSHSNFQIDKSLALEREGKNWNTRGKGRLTEWFLYHLICRLSSSPQFSLDLPPSLFHVCVCLYIISLLTSKTLYLSLTHTHVCVCTHTYTEEHSHIHAHSTEFQNYTLLRGSGRH